MNQDSMPKEIILICKKRYDTQKYQTLLDALEAYYHKDYGCEDIKMDYKLAVNLFLKPTIEFMLTENNVIGFICNGLFNESYREKRLFNPGGCTEFYEVIFHRLTSWICLQKIKDRDVSTGEYKWIIDMSKYENIEYII